MSPSPSQCKRVFQMQFGFRNGYSTDHALISLSERIKCTLDSNRVGCGIFIDLQKAFDTVNHTIVLQKLSHYGIRGISLLWFQSYLKGRQQYVSINNHSSQLGGITCGVSQGSVLDPLLFLIYINDLMYPKFSHFSCMQMIQISIMNL